MELHVTPNIITTEHKLLENIQNLLIEQNELLKSFNVTKPVEAIEEIKDEITLPTKINSLECHLCGTIHNNTGSKLACAKKHKNKGDYK